MEKYNLFASTVYKTKIDPTSYDKQQIIKTMLDNYAINPVRNNWDDQSILHNNYNDWDNEQFNSIDHSSLVPVYQNLIDEFIRTVKFGKNYQYKWNFVNFSINTGKMTDHDHFWNFGESHNMFSCCHYISFDNNFHMPTQFINSSPINHFVQATEPFRKVLSGSEVENSIYYTKWSIDTSEDDFIIFPSYLKHEVAMQKFKTDYPRVVAVLNIEIIPK